ncbi:DUF1365 domain-containing protein [Rhodococcus sp. Z13]|uniref:DUF1365 domain-containing protein n=1 Tax=Rhodococcus sacchari TaxID=2962047 RepID=A0ACD4DGE1_9NOCA|nr:DUF1365 family protein [Rhodococcus sp. Z13]UYP19101.1 DUF1365 domain-containing protein [Rhodococcus sp. Z13]
MLSDLLRGAAMFGSELGLVSGEATAAPAIYRTFLRRTPVSGDRPAREQYGYGWAVDVDRLPELPWWARPFARLDPWDRFTASPSDTLRADTFRDRVEGHLAAEGLRVSGGRITALLDMHPSGDSVDLFWCHEPDGTPAHLLVEIHDRHGRSHCRTLQVGWSDVATRRGDVFAVCVGVHRPDGRAFTAAISGERVPLTLSAIVRGRTGAG